MSGNVYEWIQDWYDEGYYRKSPRDNPRGADSGQLHVLRGGSWDYSARISRGQLRNVGNPAYRAYEGGFRLVVSSVRQ